ncbi:MAG: T9SS type A sorting domain-containing protein [bacterium]|nr:T9SS type A sorting domain-containing protein [bacterium]
MKTLLLAFLLTAPVAINAQMCSHVIFPHVVSQGVGSYHITSDATMPYNDGSNFYVCAGVHLTMQGSAGSSYYLEDGAMLTLLDHDGDAVFAKGNCTIVDESTETLVVTCESSTTISKPNDPFNYVQMLCANMVFDYQQVGGSAPCSLNLQEESSEQLEIFPNPVQEGQPVSFSSNVAFVSITDLSGRVVLRESEIHSKELSIGTLNKGYYVITARTENGSVLTSRLQVN